ncbi:MAG: amidohydrolase family protein [Gemmatimonadetes bacterium]|nr:amidohydrolase family protein [Gemmatimonadota bacterium]
MASAVGIPRAAHAIVPGGGRRSGAGELLIRGGRVVNADGVVTADVRIVGEQITEVGRNLTPGAGARVIEANGMLLMPGGIDPHTHLHPSFADDLTSGTQAALAGGITTVGTFSTPRRDETIVAALDRMGATVQAEAIADVILHSSVWPPNDALINALPSLVERGQPSIKFYMVRPDFGAQMEQVIKTLGPRAHSAWSRWCTARTARCSTRRCVASPRREDGARALHRVAPADRRSGRDATGGLVMRGHGGADVPRAHVGVAGARRLSPGARRRPPAVHRNATALHPPRRIEAARPRPSPVRRTAAATPTRRRRRDVPRPHRRPHRRPGHRPRTVDARTKDGPRTQHRARAARGERPAVHAPDVLLRRGRQAEALAHALRRDHVDQRGEDLRVVRRKG